VDDPLAHINTHDAHAVADAFHAATQCNLNASCRHGAIDLIPRQGTLIATGDIHDNPLHLARVLSIANLQTHTENSPRHVIFHEVIHPDRLLAGIDSSWRSLLRIATLKTAHPESVHTLLANHELAQIVGSGIIKDGVRVVEAFNEGIEFAFFNESPTVQDSIETFIRSMPLALRCGTWDEPGIICAHSLPADAVLKRFDDSILHRDLEESDYEPRQGAAHLMVWGRSHSPSLLNTLSELWNAELFILGHQKADTGAAFQPPNSIILNSDHPRGVVLPINLQDLQDPNELMWCTIPMQSCAE
jgi:hypothetical protein